MVPGISSESEARLLELLTPDVTCVAMGTLENREFVLLSAGDEEAAALGIEIVGTGEVLVVVTDRTRKIGQVRIEATGKNNVVFFDNTAWTGVCIGHIRLLGSDTVVFFNDIGDGYVSLPIVFLRSDQQIFYWGAGSTAVGFSAEIEGPGQALVIGDDALISSGVWVRNYDMHAMHDLRSGARISRPPVDTVLERHVWLGQDALLLGCERVGLGAIVGARSLVKSMVPPRVVMAGTPARVVRTGTSWGRDTYGMSPAERVAVGVPATPVIPGAGG